MLARFATGASFSLESRGGGRESNSRFLLFMIQMARHLFDQGNINQRRAMAKAITTYLTSSSTSDSKPSTPGMQPSSLGTEETFQFMMVNSLLSESYDSWLQHRRAFLQRGIYHAYMQHTHGRSTSRGSSSSNPTTAVIRSESGSSSTTTEGGSIDDLLAIVRPMLVYTGLIEQLQRFFKVVKKSASVKAEEGRSTEEIEGEENKNLEGWEMVMKERLLNVREMVGFSKELLSWLDEVAAATDLQEAFDIIGVLSDVLADGLTNCQDFVHAAINAGKS